MRQVRCSISVLISFKKLINYFNQNWIFGRVIVEAVYVDNTKLPLREQSKVEDCEKYISVLAVSGITVTPRVKSSSIINFF